MAKFLSFLLVIVVSSSGYASKHYGKHLCNEPGYRCENVKRGQTWASLFPDPAQRHMVRVLNRTNMPLRYRSFIVLPDNLEQITLLDLSPFVPNIEAPGERIIIVNLNELAFAAYNQEGKQVHWGAISGGKNWCSDVNRSCETVTGSFRVYSERGKHCVSNKFPIEVIGGGAPMPYCMFFHGGYALHASATVPGYNASHGCVRMFYRDARWLSKYFVSSGRNGTRVIVNRN